LIERIPKQLSLPHLVKRTLLTKDTAAKSRYGSQRGKSESQWL